MHARVLHVAINVFEPGHKPLPSHVLLSVSSPPSQESEQSLACIHSVQPLTKWQLSNQNLTKNCLQKYFLVFSMYSIILLSILVQ